MKLLFCASEAYPFAKSGGLADVAYALPKALSKHIDTTLMLPWYRFMKLPQTPVKLWKTVLSFGGQEYPVSFWQCEADGVKTVLVKTALLYESEQLYGLENDDLRFMLFCRAIVSYAQKEGIDLLHLNDWHTAPAALFAKARHCSCKVVFTIHNLAFQGIFPAHRLFVLGIESYYFQMEMLEFHGQINFMKAGIAFADAVTTVSPTYAGEILRPEYGCGLEGFLYKHRMKLHGILNGIDTDFFDPRNDPMTACLMKRKISTFKRCNKKAFWGKATDLPLFVFIGRMTAQKGVDLLTALHEVLEKMPLLFAFLGDGESEITKQLEQIATQSPNIRYHKGYDEALAHQMYAAADFLVMPSRFEPCGLNQMIAMHYGTVPVVHKTGGLADTVHERGKTCGRGVVFGEFSEKALLKAIEKALRIYTDKERLESINRFNMACDFSFEKAAEKYLRVYHRMKTLDN